jgi:alpha-1,2-mannosyltransferase
MNDITTTNVHQDSSRNIGTVMIMASTIVLATFVVLLLLLFLLLKMKKLKPYPHRKRPCHDQTTFAFFHPYASGGGGGERVLWKMIQYLQQQQQQSTLNNEQNEQNEQTVVEQMKDQNNNNINNNLEIVIYTIDPPSTDEYKLRKEAERRFDVQIAKPIRLISLQEHQDLLQPRPFLSLVMESYGTMRLARQALKKLQPDVFCDTTGCAFTFAVVRWLCPATVIMAYVHYPTISTDMMLWEWKKYQPTQTTSSLLSNMISRVKTLVKLIYYWCFAICYGLVGSMADLVMVNSTWTYNHIASLWRFSSHCPIQIVYPPCRVPDTLPDIKRTTTTNTTTTKQRKSTIISIGQFRPEKNHKLQLQALAVLFHKYPELKTSRSDDTTIRLVLIGSCRNDADQGRLQELQHLVQQLDLLDHVVFNVNPPYTQLQAAMEDASIGIHTMRQEHFGIGIVEMMAAGLLVIAHDSGGPKSDILHPGVSGFLATSAEEYAEAIRQALTMEQEADLQMRKNAKKSALRFSDVEFDKNLALALNRCHWQY